MSKGGFYKARSTIGEVKQAVLERETKTVRVEFMCSTEYGAIALHDTIEQTMRAGYLCLDWEVQSVRIEGHDP